VFSADFLFFAIIVNLRIFPELIFFTEEFFPFKTKSFRIVSPSGSLIPGLFSIITCTLYVGIIILVIKT
ncbi:uncharacterized protein METZ01_LOCUS212498, partial [marine metagenome]